VITPLKIGFLIVPDQATCEAACTLARELVGGRQTHFLLNEAARADAPRAYISLGHGFVARENEEETLRLLEDAKELLLDKPIRLNKIDILSETIPFWDVEMTALLRMARRTVRGFFEKNALVPLKTIDRDEVTDLALERIGIVETADFGYPFEHPSAPLRIKLARAKDPIPVPSRRRQEHDGTIQRLAFAELGPYGHVEKIFWQEPRPPSFFPPILEEKRGNPEPQKT